ncbi:MAG: phage tail protein [Roseibium sp.]
MVGWLRSGISSPREQLDLLAQVYRFDMVETGSLIKCIPHGMPPTVSLAETDLASPDRETPDWNLTRAQETDLPVRASFAYWDAVSDYRQTTSSAGRLVTTSARHESLAAPLVIDPAEADGIVEAWLLGRWVAREQAEFSLPPSKLGLEPGDVLTITIGGRTRQMRLARIVDGNGRQCEAVAAEPSVNDLNQGTTGSVAHPAVNSYGEVVLEVLDLPVLSDTQSDHKPWLAAYASPWAGAKVLEGSRIVGAVLAPATLGRTTTDLSSGTPYRFDRANTLTVKLSNGTFSSVSEDELLEGTVNALAVQNSDGDWEILQFATAELIADKTWRLSVLLRGRLGTEHAMRDPVLSGARVVLIDTALTQADVPLADRGIARDWSYGPAPLPSTDATFKERSNTLQAVALKPFSPVHLRGRRDAAGNLSVTWIRRTRRDGTWADGTDVPLNEDSERYDLEVLNGSTVVRTAAGLKSPAYAYSTADQITDFGSAQASVSVRVTQVSGTVGRSTPEEKIL